jgi:hypothetical protein
MNIKNFNLIHIVLIFLITICVAYIFGLILINLVDNRLSNIKLNIPNYPEFDELLLFPPFLLALSVKLKFPLKLPVKSSIIQFFPKKEHNKRPNNKIRNINNASVFIV